jgi:hypothetical protein
MKKVKNIEITELFMAKAGNDFTKCFYGTIKRGVDKEGNPKVWGKIGINGGHILATASNQQELGEKLDEMVVFVLNKNLQDFGKLNSDEKL